MRALLWGVPNTEKRGVRASTLCPLNLSISYSHERMRSWVGPSHPAQCKTVHSLQNIIIRILKVSINKTHSDTMTLTISNDAVYLFTVQVFVRGKFKTRHLPLLLQHRLNRFQPLRNLSRGRQDPHELQRTLLPPYPLPHTSGRRHAWHT